MMRSLMLTSKRKQRANREPRAQPTTGHVITRALKPPCKLEIKKHPVLDLGDREDEPSCTERLGSTCYLPEGAHALVGEREGWRMQAAERGGLQVWGVR